MKPGDFSNLITLETGDYVEETTEGMKVEGPDPNRVEDHPSEHLSPGHHKTLSDGLSPINPYLINPKGKSCCRSVSC
jgi:hypothetical protein